jgi:hypothetical protein
MVSPSRSPSKTSNQGKRSWAYVFFGGALLLLMGIYCFWGITVSKHVYHPNMIHNKNKLAARSKGTITDEHIEHAGKVLLEAEKLITEHSVLRGKINERSNTHISDSLKSHEKEPVADSLIAVHHVDNIDKNQHRSDTVHEKPEHVEATATASSSSSSRNTITTAKSGTKDLVLGMAQETDPKNLIVFCASLREVSDATVVIFINAPIPKLHQEIADKYSITFESYNLQSFDVTIQKFHPSTLRWGMMHSYLMKDNIREQYRRVWMIDVRDSFFQNNPFTMLQLNTKGFYTFKGVEDKSIRSCGWNGPWISDCFNKQTYESVADNNIICSGVSMGDIDSVIEYLYLMSSLITNSDTNSIKADNNDIYNNNYKKLGSKFPNCERNGVDQGVHNVLVHSKLIPYLTIYNHMNGPVANLQAKQSKINGLKVYNKIGKEVDVVHQYDRYPELQKKLFKKYVYWVNTDDQNAQWNFEPTCLKFNNKNNYDKFHGICDLKMQGGATSPASCCKYCSEKQGCQAFTYYSAKCFLKSCKKDSNTSSQLSGAVSGWLKDN